MDSIIESKANIFKITTENRDNLFLDRKNEKHINKRILKDSSCDYKVESSWCKALSRQEALEVVANESMHYYKKTLPASKCVAKTSEELLLKTNINARNKMYNWANSSRKYSFDEFVEEMDKMWRESRQNSDNM